MIVVQIAGLISGKSSPFEGQWLVEYDPTRPGRSPAGSPMHAHIVCSPDRSKARRFADIAAVHRYVYAESGRPYPRDKPLAAFNLITDQEQA